MAFLDGIGRENGLELGLLSSVRPSNEWHKHWAWRQLERRIGSLADQTVAVWGLTYKPGTNTLRRSAAVELCAHLANGGTRVQAYDPAIRELPLDLARLIVLRNGPAAAVEGASALVVATEWPEFRGLDLRSVLSGMRRRLVLDPNRFLANELAGSDVDYVAVGVPSTEGDDRE